MEEQKTKEALELLGRKHKLGQLEKGCYKGWSRQGPKVAVPAGCEPCLEQHVLPLFLARSQPAGIELRNKKKSEEFQEDVEKIKKKKNKKDDELRKYTAKDDGRKKRRVLKHTEKRSREQGVGGHCVRGSWRVRRVHKPHKVHRSHRARKSSASTLRP